MEKRTRFVAEGFVEWLPRPDGSWHRFDQVYKRTYYDNIIEAANTANEHDVNNEGYVWEEEFVSYGEDNNAGYWKILGDEMLAHDVLKEKQ